MDRMPKTIEVQNERGLQDLAANLAGLLQHQSIKTMIIFLRGDLGAGKTTFAKGFMKAMGFQGLVKSPTYTLVEMYEIGDLTIYHMDWYRLQDETALEEMGILAHLQEEAIILIEWPLTGISQMPIPDWIIELEIVPLGRNILIHAMSEKGHAALLEMDS